MPSVDAKWVVQLNVSLRSCFHKVRLWRKTKVLFLEMGIAP